MTAQDVPYVLTTELIPQQTALGSTSKLQSRPVFRFFQLFYTHSRAKAQKERKTMFANNSKTFKTIF